LIKLFALFLILISPRKILLHQINIKNDATFFKKRG
jgi:hypothetical protein